MKMFVCGVCGYIAFNELSQNCPVCGAPKEKFTEDANALKKPADPRHLNDVEKKHIPFLIVNKQCDLVKDSCVDVYIKVGEIVHVMEAKHWIRYIDVYHDDKHIGRHWFVPEKVNPVVGLHLKVNSGKVTAIENCNLHGKWLGEISL